MYAPIDREAPLVWTVDGLLDEAECGAVIAEAEAAGFETASIAYREGARLNPEVRNNERVTFDHPELRARLFERAAPHLPPLFGARATRLNERLRVYRYGPGERFAMHRDGSVELPGERSRVTLMVYLDDEVEGGETWFPRPGRTIAPRLGVAVLFQHALLHEAKPVRAGAKHVLRTDVFYRS